MVYQTCAFPIFRILFHGIAFLGHSSPNIVEYDVSNFWGMELFAANVLMEFLRDFIYLNKLHLTVQIMLKNGCFNLKFC